MNVPKAPLEALHRVRQVRVEQATRALASRVVAHQVAAARKARAERERARHDEALRDLRDTERARLTRGELRVVDLARAGAHEVRLGAERDALAAEEAHAEDALREARAAEVVARAEVARRAAEAELVARARTRLELATLRARDSHDEELAAEVMAARCVR